MCTRLALIRQGGGGNQVNAAIAEARDQLNAAKSHLASEKERVKNMIVDQIEVRQPFFCFVLP